MPTSNHESGYFTMLAVLTVWLFGLLRCSGCACVHQSQPTTSADDALAGAQLPFGGHKGAAIAMMVELLAAGTTL